MRKSLDRKINRDEDFDKYEDDEYFSGDLKEEDYVDQEGEDYYEEGSEDSNFGISDTQFF